jgi:hypothetical protein
MDVPGRKTRGKKRLPTALAGSPGAASVLAVPSALPFSLLLSSCLGLRGPEAGTGSNRLIDPRSLPSSDSGAVEQLWTMHKLDTPELLLPDGLDQADLGGDGDVDIVANCEEYHRGPKVLLAVVWFENPR